MGNFKIGIKFDKKFLNSLTKESNSGVEVQTAKHHLALHPIHLNNFNKSVKDLLNEGVARYNKNLDGILLGYGNIKLLSNMGAISSDSPYIHYDFLVDFFIFKSEIGKELRGIVNRKSKDHVGLLVYNAFNVSIPKPQNAEKWLGNSVQMGYEVLFRITFIDFSSHLPHIKGELISIISEGTNVTSNSKTPLKNKKIIFDMEEDDEPDLKKRKLVDDVEDDISPKKSKKKKRKHQTDDEEVQNLNESVDACENKSSKKSKKKKEKKQTVAF